MTSLATSVTPGTWVVDPSSTLARFRVRDLLHKPVLGTIPVRTGVVRVAADGSVAVVRAELDLAGVSTGHSRRDRDLHGRRFLDVEASPVLRFAGGPGRPDGTGGWVLPGTLTLRGLECPVNLAVELLGEKGGVAQVRATTTLDRRDAGIRVPRLLVGTAVEVTVEASLTSPGRSQS